MFHQQVSISHCGKHHCLSRFSRISQNPVCKYKENSGVVWILVVTTDGLLQHEQSFTGQEWWVALDLVSSPGVIQAAVCLTLIFEALCTVAITVSIQSAYASTEKDYAADCSSQAMYLQVFSLRSLAPDDVPI